MILQVDLVKEEEEGVHGGKTCWVKFSYSFVLHEEVAL
jgi:hypothetical protein